MHESGWKEEIKKILPATEFMINQERRIFTISV